MVSKSHYSFIQCVPQMTQRQRTTKEIITINSVLQITLQNNGLKIFLIKGELLIQY